MKKFFKTLTAIMRQTVNQTGAMLLAVVNLCLVAASFAGLCQALFWAFTTPAEIAMAAPAELTEYVVRFLVLPKPVQVCSMMFIGSTSFVVLSWSSEWMFALLRVYPWNPCTVVNLIKKIFKVCTNASAPATSATTAPTYDPWSSFINATNAMLRSLMNALCKVALGVSVTMACSALAYYVIKTISLYI